MSQTGEIITLAVAIAGVVLGGLSLVVQAYQFRASGSRVRVTICLASGSVAVDEGRSTTRYVDAFQVTAYNIGRLGVSITQWGFQLPSTAGTLRHRLGIKGISSSAVVEWPLDDEDGSFTTHGGEESGHAPLPVRLEPGGSASWLQRCDDTADVTQSSEIGNPDLRGFVVLGTGNKVVSKNLVSLSNRAEQDGTIAQAILLNWQRLRKEKTATLIQLHLAGSGQPIWLSVTHIAELTDVQNEGSPHAMEASSNANPDIGVSGGEATDAETPKSPADPL